MTNDEQVEKLTQASLMVGLILGDDPDSLIKLATSILMTTVSACAQGKQRDELIAESLSLHNGLMALLGSTPVKPLQDIIAEGQELAADIGLKHAETNRPDSYDFPEVIENV